ncbi:hypothetical protein [Nostoc sp. CHAB 5715]|uniref:hypothetical protein n=1 Tax=Nostoc sp. CHAB 5715 TaxID=2780400 RepID=UPI001E2B4F9B|nr:hypothetical protein [Nostoc sp. CHAB 5715]MCC5620481.1 hypothetical protein [Nostoc sp. CHAB 5715]
MTKLRYCCVSPVKITNGYFKVVLRYFKVVLRYFKVLLRYFKVVLRYFKVVLRYFKVVLRYFKVVLRYFKVVLRYFKVVLRYFKVVLRYFKVVLRYFEVILEYYMCYATLFKHPLTLPAYFLIHSYSSIDTAVVERYAVECLNIHITSISNTCITIYKWKRDRLLELEYFQHLPVQRC